MKKTILTLFLIMLSLMILGCSQSDETEVAVAEKVISGQGRRGRGFDDHLGGPGIVGLRGEEVQARQADDEHEEDKRCPLVLSNDPEVIHQVDGGEVFRAIHSALVLS